MVCHVAVVAITDAIIIAATICATTDYVIYAAKPLSSYPALGQH